MLLSKLLVITLQILFYWNIITEWVPSLQVPSLRGAKVSGIPNLPLSIFGKISEKVVGLGPYGKS